MARRRMDWDCVQPAFLRRHGNAIPPLQKVLDDRATSPARCCFAHPSVPGAAPRDSTTPASRLHGDTAPGADRLRKSQALIDSTSSGKARAGCFLGEGMVAVALAGRYETMVSAPIRREVIEIIPRDPPTRRAEKSSRMPTRAPGQESPLFAKGLCLFQSVRQSCKFFRGDKKYASPNISVAHFRLLEIDCCMDVRIL